MKLTAHLIGPLRGSLLVFLNDKLVTDVFFADEEEGIVWHYCRNSANKKFPDADGRPAQEMLTGRVEVMLKPNAPARHQALWTKIRILERGWGKDT